MGGGGGGGWGGTCALMMHAGPKNLTGGVENGGAGGKGNEGDGPRALMRPCLNHDGDVALRRRAGAGRSEIAW